MYVPIVVSSASPASTTSASALSAAAVASVWICATLTYVSRALRSLAASAATCGPTGLWVWAASRSATFLSLVAVFFRSPFLGFALVGAFFFPGMVLLL